MFKVCPQIIRHLACRKRRVFCMMYEQYNCGLIQCPTASMLQPLSNWKMLQTRVSVSSCLYIVLPRCAEVRTEPPTPHGSANVYQIFSASIKYLLNHTSEGEALCAAELQTFIVFVRECLTNEPLLCAKQISG